MFDHTNRAALLALAALMTAPACYTARAVAPVGQNVSLAGPQEACYPTQRKRVHYAIAGLVNINDDQLQAPANTRVRFKAETDVADVLLRAIGYVFTFGLYGGSQSMVMEACYGAPSAPVAAAAPPPGLAPPSATPPSVTVSIPNVAFGAGVATHTGRRAARGRAPVEDDLPFCQSGIDCGSGEFCRDRGDGIKLCMGNGVNGDYCSSGIDCDHGLFCKSRGDGFKVCMGNGGRGAFCSSSIDCDDGFCKNRGDGRKVCM